MYFIYRSRFQPEFSQPHKLAGKKFFNLQKSNYLQNAQLVFGIVDEHLFLNIYSLEHQASINEILKSVLGTGVSAYKLRFHEVLNPTGVGQIKKSIWGNWRELWPPEEPIRYIIMCNAAWSGICLYDTYLRKDPNMENAIKLLLRWLPTSNPNEIGWYFPIFDRDDINDMGLIASLIYKILEQQNLQQQILEQEKKIAFARFNYNINQDMIYNHKERLYGAYAKIVSSIYGFADFWGQQGSDIKKGFEIVSQTYIPFVYNWGYVLKIYEEMHSIFSSIEQNTGNAGLQSSMNSVNNDITDRIERLKDPKEDFYEDLLTFYTFIHELPTRLNNIQNIPNNIKNMFNDLNNLCNFIIQPFNSQGDWLEDSYEAELRFKNIMESINNISNQIKPKEQGREK